MKNLVLITNAFPFLPGEQFIEEEIRYWAQQDSFRVTILPTSSLGERRELPETIGVNQTLAINSRWTVYAWTVRAIFDTRLYKEISTLLELNKFGPRTLVASLIGVAKLRAFSVRLNRYIESHGSVDVVYCYWNNYAAFAASDIFKKQNRKVVVSRIHRYDMYEERKQGNYLPLKRQYINRFDRIFCLSNSAKDYLAYKFSADSKKLSVAPLGVAVGRAVKLELMSEYIHIVSCSFCTREKRLDRIIVAVRKLAELRVECRIKWSHIGGGPLLGALREKARIAFSNVPNASYNFNGTLSNAEVKRFYEVEDVNVFINLSESEGIPVSIMEAMAAGIPVIAPDIGGISSLVDNENGVLLSEQPSMRESVDALVSIVDLSGCETRKKRISAYEKIATEFNSRVNYESFIRQLEGLSSNA